MRNSRRAIDELLRRQGGLAYSLLFDRERIDATRNDYGGDEIAAVRSREPEKEICSVRNDEVLWRSILDHYALLNERRGV